MKRKPCRGAYKAARARCRSRNAGRSCSKSDSDPGRSGALCSRRSWCYRERPGPECRENTRRHARVRAATLPSAGRALPRPRCSCWRRARPRTAALAKPGPSGGRKRESSRPPNRRIPSRPPCALAGAPGQAWNASAGTDSRTASNDSLPGWLAGIPPTAVARSRACCCVTARGWRQSQAACAPASSPPRLVPDAGTAPLPAVLHPNLPAKATQRRPPRRASGTCAPCSPRSSSFARSAGSPISVHIGGVTPPVVSAWTVSWPALCSSLGGFIVPV